MGRLKSALKSKYKDRVQILNPKNCDEQRLYFKGEKIAKVKSLSPWTVADYRSWGRWRIILLLKMEY